MSIQLPKTSRFVAKDQAKSDRANKFIGRGSARSSTNAYRVAWGELANCGEYAANDVVFVSVEGARSGRVGLDTGEVIAAIKAGASFIADTPYNRQRSYNVGERELALLLSTNGYREASPGFWVAS